MRSDRERVLKAHETFAVPFARKFKLGKPVARRSDSASIPTYPEAGGKFASVRVRNHVRNPLETGDFGRLMTVNRVPPTSFSLRLSFCGTEGRGFKSHRSPQSFQSVAPTKQASFGLP